MASDKLITPEFRGSFVALDRPKRMKGDDDGDPKYQMLCGMPANDKWWKKAEKAVEACAKEKWGKVPPRLKSPIKDGDDVADEYPNLEGCKFFNAGNTRKPGVVDEDLDPIMDAEELYSGAWYRASIRPYAWEHPTGGKGVSFSLDNVMKVRDDDRFDGATSAEEDFAQIAKKGDDGEDSLLD